MMATAKPNGAAAAAILSAAIGVFFIGLFTTLAEASAGFSSRLNLWSPAGPLTGKTAVPVVIWLVVWVLLHARLKTRSVEAGGYVRAAWILIALGFLLTFPPFFDLFAQ